MKNNMRNKALSVVAAVATLILVGCAGQPQQLVVQQPDEQKPQTITFRTVRSLAAHRAVRQALWLNSWSIRTIET